MVFLVIKKVKCSPRFDIIEAPRKYNPREARLPETASQRPDHSPTLVGSFEEILTRFREDLARRHAATIILSEASEPRVALALQWLMTVRNQEGYWGYASPGGTALCALAMESWWGLAQARPQLATTTAWLSRCWEEGTLETPWDTAVVGRVLCLLGGQKKAVREIRDRLLEYNVEDDWSDRPHHAAEILNTLAVIGSDLEVRDAWSAKLRTLLQTEEYVPSVLGQVLYALLVSGNGNPDSLEAPVGRLVRYLESTRISNSEFLNHAHTLRALAATAKYTEVVGLTLDKMFFDARRQDGSWYHEPFLTAWALLALREAKGVRRVVVELPAFNAAVERCIRDVEQLGAPERKERRLSIGVGFTLGFSAAALGGLGIFYAGDSLLISGILVTALTALIASSFNFVRRRIT